MKMKRILAGVIAVMALAGLMVVPVFAADKLVVKDAGGLNTVFVVQDTGQVGVGTATPTGDLNVNGLGTVVRGIVSSQHSTNAWAAMATFMKSRGTEALPTAVATGDYLGFLVVHPYDGAGYIRSGAFGFRVDGPVAAGSVPVALDIITGTSGGGGTAYGTERLTVSSSGNVGIGTTNPTLGPLQMASGAYVTAGGVWTNASSRQFKDDIHALSTEKAMETLKDLTPVTFHYKNASDEKHVGFIAEDVPELVAMKDRKSLSPMDVVAVLTKVVQEQNKTIAELSEKMGKLEAQVVRIKSKDMFGSVDLSLTSGN